MTIAEGYIPSWSDRLEPKFTGRETSCLPNTDERDASATINLCFQDREPVDLTG